MEKIAIPKDYISASQSYIKDVHDLCNPLFCNTDISACNYIRLYKNGDYFHLSSNPKIDDFMFFTCKGKFNIDIKILEAIYANKKNPINKIYLPTQDLSDNNYWRPVYNEFNLKDSFNIIEKHSIYYEAFWFVTNFGKNRYNFSINHNNILENFIFYFKEKSSYLIRLAEKNKITWSNNTSKYCQIVKSLQKAPIIDDSNIQKLKNAFMLKRYPIVNENIRTYITMREFECLQYAGLDILAKKLPIFCNFLTARLKLTYNI